ncbi:MAG: hypothetical protein ORO03_01160 [Alphaproteobacteria bacterium]|nr:hypothetical protein [Alphaproteobacteria bacterium]
MLLSDVFTDMQMQNGITAAIHNLDYFIETMNDLRAGKAQGTIDKDVDITMLSVSKRAEMAMNQLKALSGQIGATLLPVINGIATITKPFLQVFGWIADHFPKMTAALVLGLGAAYIVGGQRTMAFIRAIMGIAPAASGAAAVRNLAGVTGQLAAAATAATAATMRNNAVRQLSNAQALQAAGVIRGGKIGAMMGFGGSALGFAQRNGARLGMGALGILAAGASYSMADKTGETEAEETQKKRDAAGDLLVNTASAVAMALGPVGIAVGAALQVTDAIVKGTAGNSLGHYAARMVTRDKIPDQDKANYIASIADPNFDFAKHTAEFKARKAREEQVKNGKIDAGGTINLTIDHKNAFIESKTNDPRMAFNTVYSGRAAMAHGF